MGDFEIKDGILIKYNGHDKYVVVPEGTIAIGNSAFKNNDSIISVELPSSLCIIDKYAFAHCVNLSSINLPDSLTKISSYAFSSCYKLTLSKKELPQSLIDIEEEAFSNCKLLTELVFPSKLVSIDARAFFRCESLSKIKLSKAIKFISSNAFLFTKMKEVFYSGTIEEFGAIKTALPPEFGEFPSFSFSDSSSGSLNLFGAYDPVLHCKDVKGSFSYLLCKLQGLLEEIEQ